MSENKKITISSLGYADDTIALAGTWEDIQKSHAWMMEFCNANAFRINANKSRLITNVKMGEERLLTYTFLKNGEEVSKFPDSKIVEDQKGETWIIDVIYPNTTDHFKYLGLIINLELKWERQIKKMQGQLEPH